MGAGAAALTAIKQLLVAEPVDESFTCPVKLNVPAAEGVPVSAPVEEFNARPVGSPPLATEYVYPGTPPPATNAELYVTPA